MRSLLASAIAKSEMSFSMASPKEVN